MKILTQRRKGAETILDWGQILWRDDSGSTLLRRRDLVAAGACPARNGGWRDTLGRGPSKLRMHKPLGYRGIGAVTAASVVGARTGLLKRMV